MNEMTWVIGALVLVLVVAVAAVYAAKRQRSRQLRTHFGPEYDVALAGFGDRRSAERALVRRARRVSKLRIRPLSSTRRDELHDRWQVVQSRFVDEPSTAIDEAHALLLAAMHEEGYPSMKFADEVDLLSVHHPGAVQHYRAAHHLAEERPRDEIGTEDLRQALIHYRALFEDLLKEERRET